MASRDRSAQLATTPFTTVRAPSSWETAGLVQIAIDFLGTCGLVKRAGEREPDGSEWVIADSLDEPRPD